MNSKYTRYLTSLLICAGIFISVSDSEAIDVKRKVTVKKLSNYCAYNLKVAAKNLGLIYKNSAPMRGSAPGSPIVGYRKEPTLIMKYNVSSKGTTSIYDKKGNKIGACPWAPVDDAKGGRYRCTMQTSSLRRAAVKNTNSPTIYIKLNGKICVEVPDAGKCYGSVKGLCTQTIK